jgi:hypothetical protein
MIYLIKLHIYPQLKDFSNRKSSNEGAYIKELDIYHTLTQNKIIISSV